MLPIPNHLQQILKPIGDENDEFDVEGEIQCVCGNSDFKFKIVADDSDYETDNVIKVIEINDNYFLIIKLQCNNCDVEHLVFDKHFHGWDGFLCETESKKIGRPITKIWCCNKCKESKHKVNILICSQGKELIMLNTGDDFDINNWTEAFEWIVIKTECIHCGEKNDEWISYETC